MKIKKVLLVGFLVLLIVVAAVFSILRQKE